jgi:O-antigen/teichoic acid export membrane protein
MSIRNKTLHGVFWAFSQQFSVQFINFGIQIVLARILLPEDFGLIAMIQIFIAIGQTLMDGGMTSSLIRTVNADQRDYSTVFFINLFSSIFVYTLLFCVSPFISSFFEQPQLTDIIRLLTLSFIIQAFVGVQNARLTKELNFKLQMYMQLPASIIGGIVGITLALNGYGVWSLVWLKLITTFIFMIQHWFRTNWRPSLLIARDRLFLHFNFGYKLTLSGILTNIYTNSYLLIIGKFFPAAQLGFYTQANNLRMFPVRNLTTALQRVTYPLFSTIQDDNLRLKNVFKKITRLVFYLVVPVMLMLTVLAEPLFELILTKKWLPAVPYFQILAIIAIVYPLSIYNLNIILVKGQSGLHLKLEILKKVSSIIFLLLIIPYGVIGVVYAQAISMLIHAFVNIYYSGNMIEYSYLDQLRDMLPIFLIGTITALISWGFDLLLVNQFNSGLILRILSVSTLFVIIYLLLSILFKLQSFKDVSELLSKDLLAGLSRSSNAGD